MVDITISKTNEQPKPLLQQGKLALFVLAAGLPLGLWVTKAPFWHEASLLCSVVLLLAVLTRRNGTGELMVEAPERTPFHSLIHSAPEAVVVLDADTGKFSEANQRALQLFKLDLKTLRQMGPVDLSPPIQPNGRASQRVADEKVKAALAGKTPVFDWTHLDSTGGALHCEVRLVRLPANGKSLVRGSILPHSESETIYERGRTQSTDEGQRTEELAALALAGASIASTLDLDKVLQVVTRQVTHLLDIQACLLSEWVAHKQAFKLTARHQNSAYHPGRARSHSHSLAERLGGQKVIRQSKPIQKRLSGNTESRAEKEALKDAGLSAVLLLPLAVQGKTIGLIELHDVRPDRSFSENEIYLAQTLCHQAAIAIENARLFQATHRQLEELKVLQKVTQAATEATDEDQLIDRVTQVIRESLYPDNFGVLLLSPKGDELVIHPSYEAKEEIKDQRVPMNKGVTGRVAASGHSLRVDDIRQEKHYLDYDSDTRSELAVPMKLGDRVIGVINTESRQLSHFTLEDERLLETVAGQLATGIERLRKEQAERQRAKQLAFLNRLTAEMTGVLDRRRLFQIIVQRLNEQMNYYSTQIFTIDEEHEELVMQAVHGKYKELAPPGGYRQSVNEGLLGLAVRRGETVVANDVEQHPDHLAIPGMEAVRAELVIPVKIYKKVVLLVHMACERVNAFGESEVAALSTLADQISISLESISLFDATRRQLQELTVLHAVANAAVTSATEDELLERATEIIGATIYPDTFGFLMLDEYRGALAPHPSYRGINSEALKLRVPLDTGISGAVASSGKPWRVPDVRKEARFLNVNPDTLSEICVPITNSKGVQGVINAESRELDHFTDADMRLLSTIAGQIGSAIERLRLHASERTQRQEAESLREVAEILSATTDSSTVLKLILDQLKRLVPFDSASIQLVKGKKLVLRALAGSLPESAIGFELPIDQDRLAHPILYEKKTVLHEDISNHPDWLTGPAGTESIKSWIGAPLIVRGECIGVLTADGYQVKQFSQADADLVSTFAIHAGTAMENARLFEEVQDAFVQTVTALANAVDARDTYTSGHSQRLAELASATARLLGLENGMLEQVHWAALLHDIGKIGVPDSILRKPGRLTPEEEAVMRQHPEIGARIVQPVAKLASVAPIIRAHQEQYDGKGYPDGLKGESIPLVARIISVVDAYVAMTDERIYRAALSHKDAVQELKRYSGTQFDPDVVAAFLKILKKKN